MRLTEFRDGEGPARDFANGLSSTDMIVHPRVEFYKDMDKYV